MKRDRIAFYYSRLFLRVIPGIFRVYCFSPDFLNRTGGEHNFAQSQNSSQEPTFLMVRSTPFILNYLSKKHGLALALASASTTGPAQLIAAYHSVPKNAHHFTFPVAVASPNSTDLAFCPIFLGYVSYDPMVFYRNFFSFFLFYKFFQFRCGAMRGQITASTLA